MLILYLYLKISTSYAQTHHILFQNLLQNYGKKQEAKKRMGKQEWQVAL